MWVLSSFAIFEKMSQGVLAKNTFTEAVVLMTYEAKHSFDSWLLRQDIFPAPDDLAGLIEQGFLIEDGVDEMAEWRALMLTTRNDEAHVFTLHFEPTLQCQLECPYCFENGIGRGRSMKTEVLSRSLEWFEEYLRINPEVDSLRLKFFGGEPLLCRHIVTQALEAYQDLCRKFHLDFWVEMTTNGELLNEKAAKLLSRYNWRRVQITLDGPADIHDTRRVGKNCRPTFENIMKNIRMLLSTNYVSAVDIRMTLDAGTKDHLVRLADELDALGNNSRIHLSLGLTTPSLSSPLGRMAQEQLADAALTVWNHAKEKGFDIPEEFTAGPLCVATAKHAAVLQPDGGLQKCFCTSGRKEFDFSHVNIMPLSYTKDLRFEQWKRFEECIKEKCTYLPICGGGCTFEAMVENGSEHGSDRRFCQKMLLERMNRGLLRLTYS